MSSDMENAWQKHFIELADFVLQKMAIKTDRFGAYLPAGGVEWSNPKKHGELNESVLRRHFRGKQTVGVGFTSIDDLCLMVGLDLDNHESEENTGLNLRFALVVRERAESLGFKVLIEDSDGKGGIHVWIIFTRPIPADLAFRFSQWLARDYKNHGLEKIECFPKNRTVQHTEKKCGHYLRVFGRHHKRPHWSRLYGESAWLTMEESVELVLNHHGNDPNLIPEIPVDEVKPQRRVHHELWTHSEDQTILKVQSALNALDPNKPYNYWLQVGMCLHNAGDHMLQVWKDWSSNGTEFHPGECEFKWSTFTRGPGGVRLGTLFEMAKSEGWSFPRIEFKRKGAMESPTIRTEADGTEVIEDEIPDNAVELVHDEQAVNDEVLRLISSADNIYDHHGRLSEIIHEEKDGIISSRIRPLSCWRLRELITSRVRFYTWETTKEGDEVPRWQRIPQWVYLSIESRGNYPGIRQVEGVSDCPILRPDGTICQAPGYDRLSGFYLALQDDFPSVPDNPTHEQVTAARDALLDVVCDFPFRSEVDRAAWLASTLTPPARLAYRGVTGPLMVADANARGSGKSLLHDLSSMITDGKPAARLTAPDNDEEMRKRITSLVMAGQRIVLIDNVAARFGSESIDAALTAEVWADRILGKSETIEAPLRITWLLSGNNVSFGADTARRVLHIRLQSPLENPEDRQDFKIPDVRAYVRENRGQLLPACLTILRGFIAAGRPDQRLQPWGSFEGWSDIVRQAVVWSGLPDPAANRTLLRQTADTEAGGLLQMLQAVHQIDPSARGLRASDMLRIATSGGADYGTDEVETMRSAVESFCNTSLSKVTPTRLGNRLSHFRDRWIEGLSFTYSLRRGTNYWFVQSSGGDGGDGGPYSATPRMEKNSVLFNDVNTHMEGVQNRSTTSTTSTTDTDEHYPGDVDSFDFNF